MTGKLNIVFSFLLGPTEAPIQCVTRDLSSGGNAAGVVKL